MRSGCNPAARMRAAIHPGSSLTPTGQTGRKIPAASIAFTHFDAAALRSSFGALTINMSSGPSRSSSSTIALLPALPGLPVGSRNSMIRCSANSDRLELDADRLAQSNHCVATWVSRCVKPLSLAAARIQSRASATSRCSSPVTR